MARFVFPLQAVLDQRTHAEQRAQQAVAVVERERVELEARVGDAQREIRGYKEDWARLLAPAAERRPDDPPPDMRFVRLQAHASLSAQGRTHRLALQLAGVYQRLERARAELRRATTRRKAVETLKARQYEAWRREQARRETGAIDEIATIRAARALMAGTQ